MECVSLVEGGWLFGQNLNKWTSVNRLVYTMVLLYFIVIFYDLLDLLLSEDSWKEGVFWTESLGGRGKSKHFFPG